MGVIVGEGGGSVGVIVFVLVGIGVGVAVEEVEGVHPDRARQAIARKVSVIR